MTLKTITIITALPILALSTLSIWNSFSALSVQNPLMALDSHSEQMTEQTTILASIENKGEV